MGATGQDYFAHLVVSKTTGKGNEREGEIRVIQYQAAEVKIPLQFWLLAQTWKILILLKCLNSCFI